jgi:hypothetical protein
VLCIRDYGLYDLAMLRAPKGNVLQPQLHKRGDGTLAYYFSYVTWRWMPGPCIAIALCSATLRCTRSSLLKM